MTKVRTIKCYRQRRRPLPCPPAVRLPARKLPTCRDMRGVLPHRKISGGNSAGPLWTGARGTHAPAAPLPVLRHAYVIEGTPAYLLGGAQHFKVRDAYVLYLERVSNCSNISDKITSVFDRRLTMREMFSGTAARAPGEVLVFPPLGCSIRSALFALHRVSIRYNESSTSSSIQA